MTADIAMTQGAFGAIALALRQVGDVGDEVVIPEPGWFYAPMLRTADLVPDQSAPLVADLRPGCGCRRAPTHRAPASSSSTRPRVRRAALGPVVTPAHTTYCPSGARRCHVQPHGNESFSRLPGIAAATEGEIRLLPACTTA